MALKITSWKRGGEADNVLEHNLEAGRTGKIQQASARQTALTRVQGSGHTRTRLLKASYDAGDFAFSQLPGSLPSVCLCYVVSKNVTNHPCPPTTPSENAHPG